MYMPNLTDSDTDGKCVLLGRLTSKCKCIFQIYGNAYSTVTLFSKLSVIWSRNQIYDILIHDWMIEH